MTLVKCSVTSKALAAERQTILPTRRATGLLALALLASLGLLTPEPAKAQTSTWSATLTVHAVLRVGLNRSGCGWAHIQACSSRLNDDDFSYDSTTYDVTSLAMISSQGTNNWTLYLRLDKNIPDPIKTGGVLTVGSTNLSFSSGAVNNNQVSWNWSGTPWSNNDSVSVSLAISPTLSSSVITQTSATLTLANNSAAWWSKRTAPTAGTCTARTAATTMLNPTGLTPGASHTWKAYSASGCASDDEIASESFTTLATTVTADRVTQTTARLNFKARGVAWYYKRTTPTGGTCTALTATQTTESLTSLTAGTSYTYKTYSDSSCSGANEISSVNFNTTALTPKLSSSTVTQTSATLTLANKPATWYYKSTTPSGTCSSAQTAATANLTGLTSGTAYTYKAYSDSTCATVIATARTFNTAAATMTADGIKQTAARLNFKPRGAVWYYKRTTPTGGTCTALTATQTYVSLSSLPANTAHTYKAYSASGCADANVITSVAFDTLSATADPPGRPKTLTATAGDRQVRLDWIPGSGTAGGWEYRTEVQDFSVKNWTWSAWTTVPGGAAARSHTVTSLANDVTHRFQVRATYGISNANKGPPFRPPVEATPKGPPAKPTGLTAEVVGLSVTLRWKVRHDADRWELSQKTGSGSFSAWATIETTYGWRTRRHTVTGLNNSTAYAFKVRGVNALGNGAESDEVSVVAAGVEVTPTTLSIAEGATKTYAVNLTRRPLSNVIVSISQTGDGDLGVNRAALTFSRGNWNTAQQVTVSARGDADADVGTTIFAHTVRSQDPSYRNISAPSVTVKEIDGLSVSSITHNSATLSFAGNSATWYHKYTVPTGGTCSSMQTAATTMVNLTSLSADTAYTWTAYSDSTCTTAIDSVSFRTDPESMGAIGAPETAPDPVTNIEVVHNVTSLAVSWEAPEGATHYDVTYYGGGVNARAAWNYEGTSLEITCDVRTGYEGQNCVNGGTTYTVGVRARNAVGASAWANSAQASFEGPGPVTEIAVVHHGVILNVEWSAVSGATHYDVTYRGNGVNARAAWNMPIQTETGKQSLGIKCDIRPEYKDQHCVDGGSSYTVGVRARNEGGPGEWRNSASAAPPSLAVADATVEEGASSTLDFVVTLTRWLPGTVTVDYATSDGTATAGSDYTAANGKLTFAAGETSKTVSVTVLDDAHDEGNETLTFTLSNASGAPVSDATASGTISNSDPLQRQWLSRFGRTVAGQMSEALEGRFAMAPGTPSHMIVGGERLDFSGVAPLSQDDARWDRRYDRPNKGEVRGMDMRELLLASSFHLTEGDVSGKGAMTGWGRVLTGSSSASTGGLTFTSETVTGLLGMDWERGNLLVGLALSESVETSTASGSSEYGLEGSLSLLTPYARVKASDRLSFWSMIGTGQGGLSFAQGDAQLDADIAMQMVAAGGRADLLRPGEGGVALALKTDAFFVRTESESVSLHGVGNLAGATGDASRVRAVLEGSRAFALLGGGAVEPSLTLGLRHDGGDAETGTGVEVGAGLSWSDPSGGIASDLRVYSLAAHEDTEFEEWGVSGSLRIVPHASGRGMSLSMTPSWGAVGQGGRVWSKQPSALVDEGDGVEKSGARLDMELGYGLFLSDGLTGTPYVGFGLGEVRDYRLGWRLSSRRWQSFSLGVEASRHDYGVGNAEHAVMLRGSVRW